MTTNSRTARAVAAAIEASGKTQAEVTRDMGLHRANALSMIKTGVMKMPIDRIPAFSRATGTNARELLEIALCEYHPEIWLVIDETFTPVLAEPGQSAEALGEEAMLIEDEPEPVREAQLNIQGPAPVIARFRRLAKEERRTYADMLRVLMEDAALRH